MQSARLMVTLPLIETMPPQHSAALTQRASAPWIPVAGQLCAVVCAPPYGSFWCAAFVPAAEWPVRRAEPPPMEYATRGPAATIATAITIAAASSGPLGPPRGAVTGGSVGASCSASYGVGPGQYTGGTPSGEDRSASASAARKAAMPAGRSAGS